MRRTALARSQSAFVAAVLMTVGGEAVSARGAAAAASVLPDGSIRYEYGRRPDPLLACKPQYVCDITLDSGETVLNMAIGDTARWVIAAGRSGPGGTTPQIFVKPTQPGLETNLVITTTKRLYDVALHSTNEARHPHISFAYPDDDAAAKAAAADHEKLAIESVLAGTPLVGPDKLDANYKFSGETTLTPDKVFNDGVRTYVQWKTLPPELPEVVVSGASGTGQLLNFRVVGAMYVIDTVLPNFDLVLGSDTDRRGRPERRLSIRHQ